MSNYDYLAYIVLMGMTIYGFGTLVFTDMIISAENMRAGRLPELYQKNLSFWANFRVVFDWSIIGLTIAFLVTQQPAISSTDGSYVPANYSIIFWILIANLFKYLGFAGYRLRCFFLQQAKLTSGITAVEVDEIGLLDESDKPKRVIPGMADGATQEVMNVPVLNQIKKMVIREKKSHVTLSRFVHVWVIVWSIVEILMEISYLWIYGSLYGWDGAVQLTVRTDGYTALSLVVAAGSVLSVVLLMSRLYTVFGADTLRAKMLKFAKARGIELKFNTDPNVHKYIGSLVAQQTSEDLPRLSNTSHEYYVSHDSQAYIPIKTAESLITSGKFAKSHPHINEKNYKNRVFLNADGTETHFALSRNDAAELDNMAGDLIGTTFREYRVGVSHPLSAIPSDTYNKIKIGAELNSVPVNQSMPAELETAPNIKIEDEVGRASLYPYNPVHYGEYPISFGLQPFFHSVFGSFLGVGTAVYMPVSLIFAMQFFKLPFWAWALRSILNGFLVYLLLGLLPFAVILQGQRHQYLEVDNAIMLIGLCCMYITREINVASFPFSPAAMDYNTTIWYSNTSYTTADESSTMMLWASLGLAFASFSFLVQVWQYFVSWCYRKKDKDFKTLEQEVKDYDTRRVDSSKTRNMFEASRPIHGI